MKPTVVLGYAAVLCFATLGQALGPFPLPWKNTAKMPQPLPAISKELASPINQGVDISDTVWEGVPFFSKYADDLVEMAVKTNKDVAARVKLIRALLRDIQHEVHAFRESFRVPAATDGGSAVDARSEGNWLSRVSADIDQAFEGVLERVHEAFPGLDRAAHHDDRQRLITHILAEAEIELVKILCAKYGLADEGVLRGFWGTVSPVIGRIVVAMGDLAEQHPWLVKFVVMGLISVLVSESWFIQPLLRLIGLGPEQAWVQRVLFGTNFRAKPIFAAKL